MSSSGRSRRAAGASARPDEPGYALRLDFRGATPEEIERGLAAARRVFELSGVTPHQAADAIRRVERWHVDGFSEPAPNDALAIHHVWDDACLAAIKAIRPGWGEQRQMRQRGLRLDYQTRPPG